MPFEFFRIDNTDVINVRRKIFPDDRGQLVKEYENTPFKSFFSTNFLEEYVSFSKKNILRGLHYQKYPLPQGKFISVLNGSIFDVAVDLRTTSSYNMKYVSSILTAERGESVWIPEGFAHGFLALEDNTIVLNRCTNEFDPAMEGGIRWDDPKLNIKWPINNPILSEKDNNLPYL